MAHLKQWLRAGWRNPGALAFVVLSLSVTLGGVLAATALHAAVSWRTLPFTDAESLVKLEVRSIASPPRWWSWPEFAAVRSGPGRSFPAMAAYTVGDVSIEAEPGRPPQALLATMVSPEFFRLLDLAPSRGRLFDATEHLPGGPRAVLLSHELWQGRYGGDPGVVGRSIELSTPEYLEEPGGRHVVVGILPPQTWLFWRRFDLVLPFRAAPRLLTDPRMQLIEHVIARVGPDATIASAQQAWPVLAATLKAAGGAGPTDTVSVDRLRSALFRDLYPKLRLVTIVALAVLLLAGANVVVSVSSTALEQRRETALRLALGASPWRLAADAGIQATLTVGAASLPALLVSTGFIALLVGMVPDGWLARLPGEAGAVRIGSIGLGALAVVAIGLGATSAAWTRRQLVRLTEPNVLQVMHADTPQRQRWRATIVAGEVALCTAVVLVATTLSLQLWTLQRVDSGVDGDRTLAFWINPNATKYGVSATRVSHFERIIEELRRVPGVQAVGGVDFTFQFDWHTATVRPGREHVPPVTALDRSATPSYLTVAGLTVLDGRWLDASDRAGAPGTVVLSRSMAQALWPQQRAVGRTISIDAAGTVLTVVGIVSDVRHAPQAPPSRIMYRSLAQATPSSLYVLVKSSLAADDVPNLQAAIWRTDPHQAIDGPWAVRDWIADGSSHVTFLARLSAILAVVAVVLAAAGVQTLSQYWVHASRRELGIRRAVGASHLDVLGWFSRRWGAVILPAVGVGIVIQFVLMRTTASQVEGIQPASVVHLAAGTVMIFAYASAAAGTALWRALRTDARVLLR